MTYNSLYSNASAAVNVAGISWGALTVAFPTIFSALTCVLVARSFAAAMKCTLSPHF